MYTSVDEFKKVYAWERDLTAKVLRNITDEALNTRKSSDDDLTLGSLAFHIAQAPSAVLNQGGLNIHDPNPGQWTPPAGTTAADIVAAYDKATADVLEQVGQWSDSDLGTVKKFFGMDWPLGVALNATIHHEIHHRGQLSILMRQAGLTVPSIYGPNREETQEFMKKMQQPAEG